MRKLLSEYPELVTQWHPTKNGDLTPNMFSFSSHKKVWWKCSEDHEWEARIRNRTMNGSGCPFCIKKYITANADKRKYKKWLKKESLYNYCLKNNLQILKQWHPVKNDNSTPTDITIGSSKKVWWKCPVAEDHEWQSNIKNRIMNNSGCPFCDGRKVSKFNCLLHIFPEVAKQWHVIKNVDLTPSRITAGSSRKVWWICEKGHEWQAIIKSRTVNGTCCPYCSGRIVTAKNCLAILNKELSKEWHPTKNGDLTPNMFSFGSHRKVWWICEKGHEYQAIVKSRTVNGTCCPRCHLLENDIKFERQKRFENCKNKKTLPFDFYIKINEKVGLIFSTLFVQSYFW